MRNPRWVKQEFLRKWTKGLQKCFNANMNFLQRKQAIKLSADLAMASTRRHQATRWSRAVISHGYNKLQLADHTTSSVGYCSRRILKRYRRVVVKKKKVKANCIAKTMLEKRRRMLKSVVPGGEFMDDDVSLIQEALDYIQSLRAQVQVMRSIANSASYLNSHLLNN